VEFLTWHWQACWPEVCTSLFACKALCLPFTRQLLISAQRSTFPHLYKNNVVPFSARFINLVGSIICCDNSIQTFVQILLRLQVRAAAAARTFDMQRCQTYVILLPLQVRTAPAGEAPGRALPAAHRPAAPRAEQCAEVRGRHVSELPSVWAYARLTEIYNNL
jgi:hypothetical protein